MTASDKTSIPDFFDETALDPVSVATGRPVSKPKVPKRKAGFYFTETLLERFTRKFHQLKLDGAPVENKSAMLERMLSFALDDMDRGRDSVIMPYFSPRHAR